MSSRSSQYGFFHFAPITVRMTTIRGIPSHIQNSDSGTRPPGRRSEGRYIFLPFGLDRPLFPIFGAGSDYAAHRGGTESGDQQGGKP